MPNLPFRSLDAATATGPGGDINLDAVCRDVSFFSKATGSPSSLRVEIEGSVDGVLWIPFANTTETFVGLGTVQTHFFRYFRANLVTLSGGTGPTVTVWLSYGQVY